MGRPAVFLDRDGTLIEDVGYPSRPEEIRILGGVARALSRLAAAGYQLIVVTNQSAIARGRLTEDDLHRFHQALDDQLDLLGARVDAYYACPHLPDPSQAVRPELAVECDCRKPKPGLILRAAQDMDLDLDQSWLVGDKWRDIAAGQAAGVQTIKLTAGETHAPRRPADLKPPTAEAATLDAAADLILQRRESPSPRPPQPSPIPPEETPASTEEPPAPNDFEPDEPAETTAAPGEPEPTSGPAEPATAGLLQPAATDWLLAETPPRLRPSASLRTFGSGQASPQAAIPAEQEAEEVPGEQPVPPPQPPRTHRGRQAPLPPSAICARCGQDLSRLKFAAGAGGAVKTRDGLLLCAECADTQPREPADRLPENTTDLLRSILLELRRLERRQHSASLTYWRLLAYVAQAGALCGLVLGLVSDERAVFLQIALLLQLVVLTLLAFERNS